MKVYEGLGVQLHTSVVLPPRYINSSINWIGGCVGPRDGLDAVEKRRHSYPRRYSNPDC
jgi:hypothetical protein